jgi:hypothetical protein
MTLTPIRKGDEYTRHAKDSVGFVRDKAPSDGFAWSCAEECGFLSEKELQAALVDLKMKQRNGRVKR